MTDDYEDVVGAAAAEHDLRLRYFAWRILEAQREASPEKNSDAILEATEAGLSMDEINAEAAEVCRIYWLDDIAPADALTVIYDQLRAYEQPESDGPGPDAEDYRRDEGTPLR